MYKDVFMKDLTSKVRAAIDQFDMIDENDNISVCVSGGKDSVFLLYALNEIKKYYPKKFNLSALTVDPGFPGKSSYTEIREFCRKNNINYLIKETQMYEIIFNVRKEKNPCSLCSRMRRGILHSCAKEIGCNKIALGHHFDDVVETLIMNLFNNGDISCFSPVTYLSRKNIHAIRPLIYCKESNISNFISSHNLPVVKSLCPADKRTQREATKKLLANLENDYPNLKKNIFTAIKKANLKGWHN